MWKTCCTNRGCVRVTSGLEDTTNDLVKDERDKETTPGPVSTSLGVSRWVDSVVYKYPRLKSRRVRRDSLGKSVKVSKVKLDEVVLM